MKPFRKHHLEKILEGGGNSPLPLDSFVRAYFRMHKSIGSKDRLEICETLYGIIRWRGLIDAQCPRPVAWKDRLEVFLQFPPKNTQNLSPHVQVSFPKFLYDCLVEAYGESKAKKFCLNSNKQAPTTVRVNVAKSSREELFNKWASEYDISLCQHSKAGITFHKKINFFALPEFKAGLFEIQDEGSQLVAFHVDASPSDHILDYCAGSGGKTLAFAPKMKNKGQIYLYDIRSHALLEAKKRLKRAGIQNAQILDNQKLMKKKMAGKMDWILLDVPCSGTGTLRRNPDMKWKLKPETISQLVDKQQKIFRQSLKFLRPNGRIVYATCSVLPEENERQIKRFMDEHDLKIEGPTFQSFPEDGGMDGFFCAVLSRK